MSQTYTKLLYHIVFSTEDRYPWLEADIAARLYEYLGGAIRSERGHPVIINGVRDHIHILAKLRQDKAISEVIRGIKANSSGWIHKNFPHLRKFAWQGGYGAFTVSQSQEPSVQRYIRDQEKHHRQKTFQEEFIEFLNAHEIEYEEKYLWV